MKQFKKLKPLLKKNLFHAWEAEQKGVHASSLSYYTKKGLIERLDRGIYRNKEAVLNSEKLRYNIAPYILTATT